MVITRKIVVGGENGVGKTTLLTRLVTNRFVDDIKSTIGVDFFVYDLPCANQKITLQLWDFAGQDRFRAIIPRYLPGSSAGILVYDRTVPNSYQALPTWIELFRQHVKNIPIIIVGTKSDLVEALKVTPEKVGVLIGPYKVFGHFLVSSKTGENIGSILERLTLQLAKASPARKSV